MSSGDDWTVRIEHTLSAISRIREYLRGMNEESFAADDKTIDAVVRNFEVIGEAVRHVPRKVTQSHPEISWQDMRDMRNYLAHRYEAVDAHTVWTTACNDLPPLVPLLRKLLDEAS